MGTYYISSTYRDLIPYREAAAAGVKRVRNNVLRMEDYTASDERPLDLCVADVKSCGAYLGILGWRYGHIPDDQTKSITELEFEAALEIGIPCYFFLSPEREEWDGEVDEDPEDLARIEAFRQRASGTPARFKDAADLKTHVVATIRIGRLKAPVPKLLPYLCDRAAQKGAFETRLAQARKGGYRRPVICVLQAPQHQALEMHLEVLQQELPRMLGRVRDRTPVKPITPQWPEGVNGDSFEEAFASLMSGPLACESLSSAADVQEAMGDDAEPYLVDVAGPAQRWGGGQAENVRAFFRFWSTWEEKERRSPVVIVLSLKYGEMESKSFFAKLFPSAGRKIQRALDEIAQEFGREFRIAVAPPLENVSRAHVDAWAKLEQVRNFVPGVNLIPRIGKLFSRIGKDEIEMEALAEELKRLLQRAWLEGRSES